MILKLVTAILLSVAIVFFFKLTPQQVSQDIISLFNKGSSIRDKARTLRSGKKKQTLGDKILYLKEALTSCGKGNRFALICTLSVLMIGIGGVIGVLINNVFLIPALSSALALIPILYARNAITAYERHIKEELEVALSIISTSYNRSEDIVSAVEENLPYIRPPLREAFAAFIGDAMAISSSVKQALYRLKDRVDDDIFREWCDTLIQCQDDRTLKDTLQPIVAKLSDVRLVNSELNSMMTAVRTEYYTMVGLVLGNVPLLYFLNKEWYQALVNNTAGKVVLGISGIVIVVTYLFLLKYTKPVEYKR